MSKKDIKTLKVGKRTVAGRKVKKLRQEGILPANIYGKKIKSLSVQVIEKEFSTLYDEIGSTGLVELELEGEKKKRPVLIHNVQADPVLGNVVHADFYEVDLTQKVTSDIPVEVIGEAPAIANGGVLVLLHDEIEVEALPAELPDKLIIDVSKLEEIGSHLTAEDLQYDKTKVVLKLDDPKAMIVQIEEPKEEKEEVPAPAEGEGEETEAKEGEEKEEDKKDEKTASSDAAEDKSKEGKKEDKDKN